MVRDSPITNFLSAKWVSKISVGIPRPFKFLWFWSSQHRKQPLTLAGSAGDRRLHTIFVKEKKVLTQYCINKSGKLSISLHGVLSVM